LKRLREDVSRLQRECLEAKGLLHKCDFELTSKKDELNRLGVEGDKRGLEMAQYSSARSSLQTAERDFDDMKKSHDDFMDSFPAKSADVKKMLKDIGDEIRYLTEATASDASLLSELNLGRQEAAGISATEKQLERERESIVADMTAAFNHHREALNRAPPSNSVEDLTQLLEALNGVLIDKRRQLTALKDNLNKVRGEYAGARAILKQEQDNQVELQARSDAVRSEIAASIEECVAGINRLRKSDSIKAEFDDAEDLRNDISIDDLVTVASETEERAYEYKSVFESSRLFMRKLEKARKKASGNCPCCLQSMGPNLVPVYEANVKKLFVISDLTGTETDYQRTLDQARALCAKAKTIEKLVQPATNMAADIQTSKNRVLELTPKIDSLSKQEASLSSSVAELETSITAKDRACSNLTDLRSRWFAAEQRILELHDRKKRHTSSLLVGSLSDTNDVKSIEELEEQQRKRADRKDELIARKDRLVNEEAGLAKRMYHFKGQLADAEKALMTARQRSARQGELEAAMKARSSDIERLEMEVRLLVGKRDDSARQVHSLESHLKSANSELSAHEQAGNSRLNDLRAKRDTVSRLFDHIEDLERKLNDIDLVSLSTKLDAVQSSIYSKEENIRTMNPKIHSLNAELSSQENRRRLVKDNLDLRELVASHDQLTGSLTALERRVGGSINEINAAEREVERSEQEKRRLTSERDKLLGSLEVYKKQMDTLGAKLLGNNFQGIDEKFRKKSIEYETTLLAAADLGLYYDALDKALQNFHVLKIKEINKIIRELWQLIYKGQDIDMVSSSDGRPFHFVNFILADRTRVRSRGRRSCGWFKGSTKLPLSCGHAKRGRSA
jgi:DNA repair protein RAD50